MAQAITSSLSFPTLVVFYRSLAVITLPILSGVSAFLWWIKCAWSDMQKVIYMWSTSDKPPFNPDFLALFRKWCFPDLYRTSSCLITLTWQHPMERRLQSFHHHSHFLDPGFSQKSLAWLRTGLRRLLATHVRPIQMGSSGQQAQIATMVEKYRLKKYLV